MEAIVDNRNETHIVNAVNGGTIPNLPADAIVEVNASVNAYGVRPIYTGPLPEPLAAHLRQYVALQKQMVKAALSGDRRDALHAFCWSRRSRQGSISLEPRRCWMSYWPRTRTTFHSSAAGDPRLTVRDRRARLLELEPLPEEVLELSDQRVGVSPSTKPTVGQHADAHRRAALSTTVSSAPTWQRLLDPTLLDVFAKPVIEAARPGL